MDTPRTRVLVLLSIDLSTMAQGEDALVDSFEVLLAESFEVSACGPGHSNHLAGPLYDPSLPQAEAA
jgi:hypothetical protein